MSLHYICLTIPKEAKLKDSTNSCLMTFYTLFYKLGARCMKFVHSEWGGGWRGGRVPSTWHAPSVMFQDPGRFGHRHGPIGSEWPSSWRYLSWGHRPFGRARTSVSAHALTPVGQELPPHHHGNSGSSRPCPWLLRAPPWPWLPSTCACAPAGQELPQHLCMPPCPRIRMHCPAPWLPGPHAQAATGWELPLRSHGKWCLCMQINSLYLSG